MLFPDNILLAGILNLNDESQFRLMIQVISIILCVLFFYNNLNAHTEKNKNRSYYISGADTKENFTKLDDYSLTQNNPNPFTDSTYISYSIPEKTNVMLEIYNEKAETIGTLVNEVQEAGNYSILFYPEMNGQRLPAGIYYYRLKTTDVVNHKKSEFVDVKKMIIIE